MLFLAILATIKNSLWILEIRLIESNCLNKVIIKEKLSKTKSAAKIQNHSLIVKHLMPQLIYIFPLWTHCKGEHLALQPLLNLLLTHCRKHLKTFCLNCLLYWYYCFIIKKKFDVNKRRICIPNIKQKVSIKQINERYRISRRFGFTFKAADKSYEQTFTSRL